MKRLGGDDLKNRSPHVKTLPPHAEQILRTPRRYLRMGSSVSARREVHLRMRSRVSTRREVHLRMRRYVSARREVHLRMRRYVSARREGNSACGVGSPHAEKVPLRAEVRLRTRRTFARMRRWLSARGERTSACGAGHPHAEMSVVR